MLVKTLVLPHFNYSDSVLTDMTDFKDLKIIAFYSFHALYST